MNQTNPSFLWRDASPLKRFRAGVSLHSHTLHSRESMAFLPRYTAGAPLIAGAIRRQEERYFAYAGRQLDFGRAFYRPPLGPREAYNLEKRQIEETLNLAALVSLTDHDNILAGSLLAVVEPQVPISVEWTIPFGPSFFHLGVHNLPAQRAQSTMSDLEDFTASPSRGRLAELLAALGDLRETLVVMNHPMWDEARIGTAEHSQLVGRFLERYGDHIHALELNGLRPWKENSRVIWLAEYSGHPLISGGDRHGLEPNANINLTNAGSFAGFVDEIRRDRSSQVLFLTQYREPLKLRMIETMWDIVRDYPELPIGRRRWSERVFFQQDDGVEKPLSAFWKGDGPWPVRCFLAALRIFKSHHVRAALRVALADPREVCS
jgi:hypothetical protein